MVLGQQQQLDIMHLSTPQTQSNSNQRSQSNMSDQQSMAGSYGNYGLRAGYQNAQQNDPGWTQVVLEEMKDLLLLLNSQGQIAYASPSSKQITGRMAKQLEGTPFTQYIHEDDKSIFLRDMDDSVVSNQPFRTHVRFQKANNTYSLVEAFGHPHIANPNDSQGRGASTRDRCTGFFLMCRPYPSKNSQLLDSFLEHKIENARLVQQIAKLKQEEEEGNTTRVAFSKIDPELPLNENPSVAHGALSDQESTETIAPNSDDSDTSPSVEYFAEQAPQAERPSHIDGIEVMTGLHYGEGERSQGLSTGVRRGRLVQCDIDITTAADQARNVQEDDRRKRLKGQHVCSDCGTADSPEWRKGPDGPKTLCNACGLRWSKKEKKRQESA
ncbi:hypothetical protein N7492_001164 [Penicillium capsulatum]|uniref:Uncharacterized protein n=1 Tax=Penicillium capsulatum TaxID=69766 RepID=A0A9W9LZF8_9EURO|nr:hypothetical protein N7492_001164 [Penicillium capsulatum]KAJ6129780.1 hypothetical protein N7512_002560 [Penicillium capsulatum]